MYSEHFILYEHIDYKLLIGLKTSMFNIVTIINNQNANETTYFEQSIYLAICTYMYSLYSKNAFHVIFVIILNSITN